MKLNSHWISATARIVAQRMNVRRSDVLGFSNSSTVRVLLPLDPFSLVSVESSKLIGGIDDSPVRPDTTDDSEDSLQDLSQTMDQSRAQSEMKKSAHENPSPTSGSDESSHIDHPTDRECEESRECSGKGGGSLDQAESELFQNQVTKN